MRTVTLTIRLASTIPQRTAHVETGLGQYALNAPASAVPGGDVLVMDGRKVLAAAFAPSSDGDLLISPNSTIDWLVSAFGVELNSSVRVQLRAIVKEAYFRSHVAQDVLDDGSLAREIATRLLSATPLRRALTSSWTALVPAEPAFVTEHA